MADEVAAEMADDAKRDFNLFIPISKSVQAEDGRIIHHGLATDESLDLEDDAIPTDFFQKSIPYLSQWGKFNWNHGVPDIGDVMQARIVTAKEARELMGPDVQVVNKAMYVRGDVYPLVDPAIASDDLKRGRHALLAEAKLGYSVQGVALRRGGRMQGAFASKIAIAPQPTNLNAVCVLAKSLGEVFTDIPDDDDRPVEVVYPEVAGELDVLLKSLEGADDDAGDGAMVTVSLELWNALLRKTLEAGSGPGVGSTGGRSLGRESLEGRRLHSPTLGGRAADRKKKRRKKKNGKLKKGKKRFPRLPAVDRRKAGKKRTE